MALLLPRRLLSAATVISRSGLRALFSTKHPEELLQGLRDVEKNLIWLSTWMIHNANNIRPSRDGIKVGGHQASCSSLGTIMTALYFNVLEPHDRVAVKPHAGPLFHAIQYLLGNQTVGQMEKLRGFGGAQSYPSRTKDKAGLVDFSTGSVGLGAQTTSFSAVIQSFLAHQGVTSPLADGAQRPGRMVALVGDAELDEGSIYETLVDATKLGVTDNWYIVDYNRQSLDLCTPDDTWRRIDKMFRGLGWQVITLKYGARMRAAFRQPGGRAVKKWIDTVDNQTYCALTFQGGAAFRRQLAKFPAVAASADSQALLASWSDEELNAVMTDAGGHCMETVLQGFEQAGKSRQPTAFIAFTVKGKGLPLAGHRDNHGLFLNNAQFDKYRASLGVPEGKEWEPFVCLPPSTTAPSVVSASPFNRIRCSDSQPSPRLHSPPALPIPADLAPDVQPQGQTVSTQAAFGAIMLSVARSDLPFADRVVTTSPDVATSTNLGSFVSQRGTYAPQKERDLFQKQGVMSANKWGRDPSGQHFELGIAENNLFIMLTAAGLAAPLFNHRLLPVGTLYDPFISRGLDSLNYGAYSDARFMLAATPSGLTLAPEGGAHQSIYTPLIGMGQPGLTYFEPAYADELKAMMQWGFEHMQGDAGQGGSVYLRLSTRSLPQPERELDSATTAAILAGAYWHAPPSKATKLVLAFTGPMAPEAMAAQEQLQQMFPKAGVALLQVTSPDLLYSGWTSSQQAQEAAQSSSDGDGDGDGDGPTPSHIESLLSAVPAKAALVTVLDGHPASLGWMGSVHGHRVRALGVSAFGQTGDLIDLYRAYGIDTPAIVAAARAMLPASVAKKSKGKGSAKAAAAKAK